MSNPPRVIWRKGWPCATETMVETLAYLRDCKQGDWPWVHLPDAHHHTINALLRHRYIVASDGLDGTRYKLTRRGEDALRVYIAPAQRRRDGLCPACGQRERGITQGGTRLGYCRSCWNKKHRVWQWRRSARTTGYKVVRR